MNKYKNFIFEVYESILDDSQAFEDRKRYLVDNIHTILEKSSFSFKHSVVAKAFDSLYNEIKRRRECQEVFTVFQQVDFLVSTLKLNDFVIFKKIYDSYVESSLQISPSFFEWDERLFDLLKENGCRIFLVCNILQTPANIIRLLLKEKNFLNFFDDIVFSEEIGLGFFNSVSLDFLFKKNEILPQETVFVTNFTNSFYHPDLKINIEFFDRERKKLYNIVLDLIES